MAKETLVIIGGVLWIGFALFHAMFWKIFNWREELPKLSPPNQMIIQASTVVMIYVFLALAYASFMFSKSIVSTTQGHVFLGALAVFWVLRTSLQFIYGSTKSAISNITGIVCAAMAVFYFVALSYSLYTIA